ncbi:MAG: YggU family protein [Deltaproteobacteria bacterium]|nr:YggU family protein [Deltaproteobacteria bacterium]
MPFSTEDKKGIYLKLYIQPRASKNEIAGIYDGTALKIRLTSPPIDGAANSACIEFLSNLLGVKKNQIEIARGQKSRIKHIRITGRSLGDIENTFLQYLSSEKATG